MEVLLFNFIMGLIIFIAVVVGFGGRYFGKYGTICIIVVTLVFALLLTISLWSKMYYLGETYYIKYGEWVGVALGFYWSINVDLLSIMMMLVIQIITFCILIYSAEYMYNDPHFVRFVFYLLCFQAFMFILVTSGNLLQLVIGWEGVGLVSFLLVNFWFTRLEANRSAIKAIIFNKVGDIGLVAACCLYFMIFKTVDFSILNLFDTDIMQLDVLYTYIDSGMLQLLICCLILAAMGKSAQLGLHAWLPDAMEGPTPVSALLHSATMVTAGIFLLLRFAPLTFYSQGSMIFIAFLGAFTMLISSVYALFQTDLKKIIAYSTCSQLGFMLVAYGLYNPLGCFFHLLTHAFFKALLFLTAGSIIHNLNNEQDIRKMGGLLKYMPLTFGCMLIGFLGLIGFPFLSGFYSKEFILFTLYTQGANLPYMMIFTFVNIGSVLTVVYSVKILYRVFLINSFNNFRYYTQSIKDNGVYINFALICLSFLTLVVGFNLKGLFTDNGFLFFSGAWSGNFNNYIQPSTVIIENEAVTLVYKLIFPFIFFLSLYVQMRITRLKTSYYAFLWKNVLGNNLIKNVFNSFVYLYRTSLYKNMYLFITKNTYYIGGVFFLEFLDRGFFEKFGPFGIVEKLSYMCEKVKQFKQELNIVSSLFNFGFYIYISSLLVLKSMCNLDLVHLLIEVCICIGIIQYLELLFNSKNKTKSIKKLDHTLG